MSNMEYHRGTAMVIYRHIEGFEAKVKRALAAGYEIEEIDYEEEYFEADDLLWVDGTLYHVKDTEIAINGVSDAVEGEVGIFSYSLAFYNGGEGFHDALGDALREAGG